MKTQKIYIASCSFGKDSIATILLALENNEPLDKVVFAEVMFDNTRGISGEIPEHIEWVYSTAIPRLEQMGVKVEVVRTQDYMHFFYNTRSERAKEQYRGKREGFVIGGRCRMCNEKKRAITKLYKKEIGGEIIQYIGITIDEPARLQRLEGTNKTSLLAKYGYTAQMAVSKCKEYNLLSPIYEIGSRGGCWFCPNASNAHFMRLYTHHPSLWNELRQMSRAENLCSQMFKYSYTFAMYEAYIEKRLQQERDKQNQLKLFL